MQASTSAKWPLLSKLFEDAPGVMHFTLAVTFQWISSKFSSYWIRVFCGLTWPRRKYWGAFTVGLEAEDESYTFMASYSQGGFPPTLPLSFPSISSFKRPRDVLGSPFKHRCLNFLAEKHKKDIRKPTFSGHCVKHSSLQNFGDAT